MATISVLYVDDEQQNLNSFKASFRSRYQVFTAISVAAALDIMSKETIHVLISDQRMPEITGVEFFKITKTRYPNIPRILLTGYTDVEVLAEAVNEGHVYRYITKPWDELELHNSVLNAYDAYISGKTLEEKVIQLQKANDELNRFIYSLSHELRAPIASALGIIDIVKMENKFNDSGEYWELMETCAKKMDYYINQTLQYYKTARLDVINEIIIFKELIQTLINLYSNTAGAGNIHFDINIDEQVTFYGEPFRTEIILANLLSNAIKSQRPDEPNKKIAIQVTVSHTAATIIIADNGIGISEEGVGKIFDQFYRGMAPNGLGLGLYILKEALDKLKGTVTVQSQPGEGAAFTVIMPNNNPDTGV